MPLFMVKRKSLIPSKLARKIADAYEFKIAKKRKPQALVRYFKNHVGILCHLSHLLDSTRAPKGVSI